jgi:hypothetical protein
MPAGAAMAIAEMRFRLTAVLLRSQVRRQARSQGLPSGRRSTDWVEVKRKGAIPPERFKRR